MVKSFLGRIKLQMESTMFFFLDRFPFNRIKKIYTLSYLTQHLKCIYPIIKLKVLKNVRNYINKPMKKKM